MTWKSMNKQKNVKQRSLVQGTCQVEEDICGFFIVGQNWEGYETIVYHNWLEGCIIYIYKRYYKKGLFLLPSMNRDQFFYSQMEITRKLVGLGMRFYKLLGIYSTYVSIFRQYFHSLMICCNLYTIVSLYLYIYIYT